MHYPKYRVPGDLWLDLAVAVLLGRRRSFQAHALRMVKGITPSPKVIGEENIPRNGPGIITVNHYSRPGFWTPWFPALISAMAPGEIYWTMTEAFTFPERKLRRLFQFLSRLLLRRVARVYGFNTMPPMPPAPQELKERAGSIRRLGNFVRENPQALISLAPEGGDQPGGVLGLPPPGFGRLAQALSRRGLLFYPVGVYEEEGCLMVCFGAPYHLDPVENPARNQVDTQTSLQVMSAIAGCLPPRLRGPFSGGSVIGKRTERHT